jgi:hypothetical protein
MSAALMLSDEEDGPPNLPPRLRIMPDHDETTDTLAPPTDPEPPTAAENEAPEPRVAIRPQPADPWDTSFLDKDDSVFSRAVKLIADAARANEAAAADRKRFEEQQISQQNEILVCVQRAEKSQEANFKIINHELRELKASDLRQDGRLAQGDERFQKIEQSIAALKDELIALVTREMKIAADRIQALESELAKAKTDAARTAKAPVPA